MTGRLRLAATLAVMAPAVAAAQFSSDIPGIPRGAISIRGGRQDRLEWTFSGYRVPGGATSGDSIAEGLRVGFGSSYRVMSQFEIGYDITIIDGHALQPPTDKSATGTVAAPSRNYIRGLAGYGFRIGGKYRPIANLDPDGNGYEIAFGAAYQPQLKPLYGIEKLGDSTRQGGQFANDKKGAQSTFFPSNPFTKLSGTTDLAAMSSYRTRRVLADAAIVAEHAANREAGLGPSPLGQFDGVSLRAGAAFRLTPGFAVGGAYWGKGSPPWRDEFRLGLPGKQKDEQFAFLLQFGSNREAGIDLMYTTPNGKYLESGRLYIRSRATR